MKTDENQLEEVIIPLGKALKDARLEASLSIEEAAENLNLSTSILTDLEDNLDAILEARKYPVIYLRGYLNNYAKLLGLTKLELFEEHKQLDSMQKQKKILKAPSLIIAPTKKRSKALPLSLLFVVVIMIALFVFQKQMLSSVDALNSVSEATPLESTPTGEHIQLDIIQNEDVDSISDEEIKAKEIEVTSEQVKKKVELVQEKVTVDESNIAVKVFDQDVVVDTQNTPNQKNKEPVVEKKLDMTKKLSTPIKETSVVTTPATLVETKPISVENTSSKVIEKSSDDANEVAKLVKDIAVEPETQKLMLSFNAECWTEVFDATGKRVAFGLYKEGRVLNLSGIAPFLLKLGDPSVVEIQYEDKIVEGEFAPGRSAKFSVPLS